MAASEPVGVVLAGGEGRRMGGDKAMARLAGRALVEYPLAALAQVCDELAVVVKRDTVLPPLAERAHVWIEPDEPSHPLAGVAHALRVADGRSVLVVAVDLPLVDRDALDELLAVDLAGAAGVVPRVDGRLQPLCALYAPTASRGLEGFHPTARAMDVVEALGVHVVEVTRPEAYLNVNRPEDLRRAEALLPR